MSCLAEHLDSYLVIRRALGFKLINEERMLSDFVAFANAAEEPTITIKTALLWAKQPTHGCPAYLSQRMRAVRGFACYLHGLDPSVQVPPLDLLPARKHRPPPYIYTDQEIAALLDALVEYRHPRGRRRHVAAGQPLARPRPRPGHPDSLRPRRHPNRPRTQRPRRPGRDPNPGPRHPPGARAGARRAPTLPVNRSTLSSRT